MCTRIRQRGFTRIDPAVVLIFLCVMSTVAVAKYLDVSDDARRARVQSVASALSTASLANYHLRSGRSAANTVAISDCADAAKLVAVGAADFTIESKSVAPGKATLCVVDHATPGPSTRSTFTIHGVY